MAVERTDEKPILTEQQLDAAKARVRFCAKVAANVVKRLGIPEHFELARATQVRDNRYRVNVYVRWVGEHAERMAIPELHIAMSFFVWTNKKGEVIDSEPPLHRMYPTEGE